LITTCIISRASDPGTPHGTVRHTPPPPIEVKDVVGELVSYDDSGAVLRFPAFDIVEGVAPSEVRLYGLPVGLPIPATADGWVDSGAAYGVNAEPISNAGEDAYHVPTPAGEPGDYIGQVVFAFAV